MKKLDANNYSTSMTGLKCKLAHKRQGKDEWSARDKAQKQQLIAILKEMITQLETDSVSENDDQLTPLLLRHRQKKNSSKYAD